MSDVQFALERNIPDKFKDGSIDGVVFKALQTHADNRGWLVELYREDELAAELFPKMSYLSQTSPGISRGPHEHSFQTDYFAFLGPGDFALYLWDIRAKSNTWGNQLKTIVGQSNKQVVIVPPGVVHAYKNISDQPGWVINLPNQLYGGPGRGQTVDEIRHEDIPDSPFALS